ncbi:hypothetical protein F53441_1863 [Fusarium austroafricanum]|uniref:Uncharacterized protein n=1 Tax=Fusarium austroafricanum TaxID=2364996 RepID=A0A8H4P1S4_9HYPO|nr:hypothetical protein F53441_1863 [Fusarium austroafricanum]
MRRFGKGREGEDLGTADRVPGSEHIVSPEKLAEPAPASRGPTIRSELAGGTTVAADRSRGANITSARAPPEYRLISRFTPVNANSRTHQDEQRQPTVPSLPIDPISQPSGHPLPPSNGEITAETLILKHNGKVYTYPECVKGVPLCKITETHPYWEQSWVNVEAAFKPKLSEWHEKLTLRTQEVKMNPDKNGTMVIRQINRKKDATRVIKHLTAILDFHEKGPISPYQLLGKQYVLAVKGVPSAEALFRLSSALSELAEFGLDISPVDWLRQRLYELIKNDDSTFKLAETLSYFNNDPKLVQLREKHAVNTTQPPPTAKKGSASDDSHSHTPSSQRKRKSAHGGSLTNKRVRLSPTNGLMSDEFSFEAWSDTDSCSGGSITKHDWRLSQVKTRLYMSHINVTQYWTWVDDKQCFEHQLLKDTEPVEWGLFRDEIDFHIYLQDVEEVAWSIEALRVHIIMKKNAGARASDGKFRGDVMASFLRERTIKRFLSFCRGKGIKMTEIQDSDELPRRWDLMISEQLPGRGDSNQKSDHTATGAQSQRIGVDPEVSRITKGSTALKRTDKPTPTSSILTEKAKSQLRKMNEMYKAHGMGRQQWSNPLFGYFQADQER